MKVVLDSNFVLVPVQFKVDVFEEIPRLVDEKIEYVVLSPCLDEIRAFRSKERRAAGAVMALLSKKGFETVKASGKPDDAIVEYASKLGGGAVVCTNDGELRARLKGKKVKTIFLRKKSHLSMG